MNINFIMNILIQFFKNKMRWTYVTLCYGCKINFEKIDFDIFMFVKLLNVLRCCY